MSTSDLKEGAALSMFLTLSCLCSDKDLVRAPCLSGGGDGAGRLLTDFLFLPHELVLKESVVVEGDLGIKLPSDTVLELVLQEDGLGALPFFFLL